MYLGAMLQAVTMVAGLAWIGSVGASESHINLDEFTVSQRGDGSVAIRHSQDGKLLIKCDCHGEIQVKNDQFDAHAKQLTYDSAQQEILLQGDVQLKINDEEHQPAVGEITAQNVRIKLSGDQVLVQMLDARLQGKVRLKAK